MNYQSSRIWLLVSLCGLTMSCFALSGCRSPYYADKGAALGGVAGAITGAALGDRSGNAGAGAVIGGAVGALTGAAVGDAIDADIAHNNAIIEQQLGRSLAGAVTLEDVVAMTRAQLSEQVIITHIRANGVAQPPQVEDLIRLRNEGVSDAVITTLQQTPPPQVRHATPAPSRPVIVEEHYYGVPWFHDPWFDDPWCHDSWSHRHHRGRSGVRWGVSFHSR